MVSIIQFSTIFLVAGISNSIKNALDSQIREEDRIRISTQERLSLYTPDHPSDYIPLDDAFPSSESKPLFRIDSKIN